MVCKLEVSASVHVAIERLVDVCVSLGVIFVDTFHHLAPSNLGPQHVRVKY